MQHQQVNKPPSSHLSLLAAEHVFLVELKVEKRLEVPTKPS
jgi:hypothetical protein